MGTRSLTLVYESYRDEQDQLIYKPIINLYRQYDGYPSGHGAELAEFLQGFKVGNGMNHMTPERYANGMGCLAAQLVCNFKQGPGQFYLHSTDATDCGQDYEYHIYESADRELCVRVKDRGSNMFGLTLSDRNECLFDGPVAGFFEFCYDEA